MTDWHYVVDGKAQGPFPEPQLRALLMEGALGADTMLWTAGMPDWRKASETATLRQPSADLNLALADSAPLSTIADLSTPPLRGEDRPVDD